jgi:enoyl-CoA hydratase/crotonobetainyl-CoA hydratase
VSPEAVGLTVQDAIATIQINRPEVRNAVDLATAEAIAAALDEVDARPGINVAVLTGSATLFSAGMDLKAFNERGERPVSVSRGGFGLVEKPPATPLIAAVEGTALGGGFEMALACDLIVAGDDAQFGLPEVRRGPVAAAGGVLRLPRRIPRNIAMELVLTGAPVSARRCLELGLVNRVVPSGQALEAAHTLARVIAANAPLAVRTAKLLVDASADWPANEAFTRQAEHTAAVRASNDAAEGARAFVEKRTPMWTGT